MDEFIPDTFCMDVKAERDAFFAQHEGITVNVISALPFLSICVAACRTLPLSYECCVSDAGICAEKSTIWICKPTRLNQGRGIFLLHTPEDVAAFRARMQTLTASHTTKRNPSRMPHDFIAQRYIQNPLLLKGKKFDVRSYFLIGCTSPYMVFFRHGYVRLTCDLYDPKSNNLTAHLTNQCVQKKNPLYSMLKEETVWSMERFNSYINENFMIAKGLQRDWVLSVFTRRMQQIMTHCFQTVRSKLECKLGYFDLIGCDFLIDEDFKVWLLEMNCNPALHTNCEVLKEVVPRTVTETLDLVMEIFNKCRCGLKLLPLSSQKDFVLLHCGDKSSVSLTKQRSRTAGPLRTACSKSQSSSKRTQQAVNISDCSWMSKKCPASSLNISSNSTDAFILTSPPIPQPGQDLDNEPASSVMSAKCLGPFSGSSFLLSSSDTADDEILETAQSSKPAEYHQSQLESNKGISTHMECTWQQPDVTSDLSTPAHEMAKPAIMSLSLSSSMLNDDSNMIEADQAEQMDAQIK